MLLKILPKQVPSFLHTFGVACHCPAGTGGIHPTHVRILLGRQVHHGIGSSGVMPKCFIPLTKTFGPEIGRSHGWVWKLNRIGPIGHYRMLSSHSHLLEWICNMICTPCNRSPIQYARHSANWSRCWRPRCQRPWYYSWPQPLAIYYIPWRGHSWPSLHNLFHDEVTNKYSLL